MIGRSESVFVLHATMNASGRTHTAQLSPRKNVREIASSVVVVSLELRAAQLALRFDRDLTEPNVLSNGEISNNAPGDIRPVPPELG